jgi:DNA-binding Xre family transcriptional regulator
MAYFLARPKRSSGNCRELRETFSGQNLMRTNPTHAVRVERIRSLMDERRISQAALARACEMSTKGVQNILNKVNDPRQETLKRIAQVLGVEWRTFLESYDSDIERVE